MNTVEVRSLEKQFGEVRALGPVDFSIPAGTALALLGESGSGKSTLLNLLGCMEAPTRGSVFLNGTNTAGLDDSALSKVRLREVGYVHQFFDLIGDLTACENVELPLWMAGESDTREKAETLLKKLGLGHRLDQPSSVLSGGEQQRVAIARALVLKPKLILADEPSGSLDSATGEQVMKLLMESARSIGATLIVATHSAQAAALFDSRIRLRDGRIEELRLPS